MLGHARLNKQRGLRRIHAGSKPVDHHVPHMLLHGARIVVVGGERMPVGDKEQALEFVLQTHPVFEHAVVVAQMQCAGGAHAGKYAVYEHGFLYWEIN